MTAIDSAKWQTTFPISADFRFRFFCDSSVQPRASDPLTARKTERFSIFIDGGKIARVARQLQRCICQLLPLVTPCCQSQVRNVFAKDGIVRSNILELRNA